MSRYAFKASKNKTNALQAWPLHLQAPCRVFGLSSRSLLGPLSLNRHSMKPFVILLHQRMRTPQNSSKCLNPTRAVIPRVESPQQLVSLSDVILERTLLASLPIHRRPWVLLYSTRVFISTPRTTWKRTTWEYYRKLKALRQYALFGLKRHPTAWMLNMSLSRTVGVTSLWRTTHVGSR